VQHELQSLRKERQRLGPSITDVADRSGLDRAVVNRLENGKQANPTVGTQMRYAASLGKRLVWAFKAVAESPVGNGRKGKRTAKAPA